MNRLKKSALSAILLVAAMTMFGAGPASATEFYKYTTPSANDTLGAGTELTLTIDPSTSLRLEETEFIPGTTVSTCLLGEFRTALGSAGGESTHPSGKANGALGWCSEKVAMLNGGELEFQNIAGTTNASVVWKSFRTTVVSTLFGISCIADTGAAGAPAGTLTGATSSTGQAKLDLSLQLKFTFGSGEGNCGDGPLTGTFIVTSPTGLIAEAK